jgi:hypothetical protein
MGFFTDAYDLFVIGLAQSAKAARPPHAAPVDLVKAR